MSDTATYIFKNTNLIDLNVFQMGFEHCEPLHAYGPALRQHYLLHYIAEGRGTLSMEDGRIFSLSKGQAFLICPHIVSRYTADIAQPWFYMWIEFDGVKAREYLEYAGLSEQTPVFTPAPLVQNSAILEEFAYLLAHTTASTLHQLGHVCLLFDAFAQETGTVVPHKTDDLQQFYIREALDFIATHYMHDMSIEEIARHCNLNRSYFSKLFKEEMGMSTQEFLIKYRMGLACDRLCENDASVGAVALAVGYQNQLHFSRAFKKIYDVSPREWRKNARRN